MSALPAGAQAAVVRGMGAFMQAARKTDLPPSLRPLQGKHQRLLLARRAVVITALDDEGLRALLLDWLSDKPTGITKEDRAVLEIAATRAEGWEQRLADLFVDEPGTAQTTDVAKPDVEREKERSRRAKEEAKKAREAAKQEVAEHQRVNANLRSRVEALTDQVAMLTAELARARKEAVAAATTAERELRKERKRADRAQASLQQAEATVRSLKQEVAGARADDAPSSKNKPVLRRRKSVADPEPARRRRLPVPKGRFADASETLADWLDVPNVHLLVDGYNVSKAEGGFGDLRLDTQRELLLQAVEKVVRRHRVKATVVFDGSHIAPGTSRRSRGPVEVEYSRPDEIADDHLIAKLEGMPKHPVVVATNDKELQRRAARLGATIATSNQLLALIR